MLLEPKFCLAFSLKKDVIIKGLSKPFLMKKDESQELKWTLHEENTNLFFITKLWALQVQVRHGSVFTTQFCKMLCWDVWGNLWFYGKQFWMRAKAQKPYFILLAANRLIPPPNSLETGNNLLFLLPVFLSRMIQSQDQVQQLSNTFTLEPCFR